MGLIMVGGEPYNLDRTNCYVVDDISRNNEYVVDTFYYDNNTSTFYYCNDDNQMIEIFNGNIIKKIDSDKISINEVSFTKDELNRLKRLLEESENNE